MDAVVAAPYTKSMLLIGRVKKISPLTVKIQRLGSDSTRWLEQKRHTEIVVISDNPATTMYVLTQEH